MASAGFSGNGNYVADLAVWVSSAGVLSWSLSVTKNSGSGYWTSDAQGWGVSVDGQYWGGSWTYDFRASTPQTIGIASGSKAVGAGNRGFSASVNMDSGIGTASPSGVIWASTYPSAPSPVGLDEITPTSMRYRFSGNSDGGSGILEWQAQLATDVAFTQNVQTVGSGGTTTFGGLTPSKRYYARSRGRNAWGWGAWSSTIDAETLSGARAWDGSAWRQCKVRRWNGTTWQYVRVRAYDGATWRNTK